MECNCTSLYVLVIETYVNDIQSSCAIRWFVSIARLGTVFRFDTGARNYSFGFAHLVNGRSVWNLWNHLIFCIDLLEYFILFQCDAYIIVMKLINRYFQAHKHKHIAARSEITQGNCLSEVERGQCFISESHYMPKRVGRINNVSSGYIWYHRRPIVLQEPLLHSTSNRVWHQSFTNYRNHLLFATR